MQSLISTVKCQTHPHTHTNTHLKKVCSENNTNIELHELVLQVGSFQSVNYIIICLLCFDWTFDSKEAGSGTQNVSMCCNHSITKALLNIIQRPG